MHDGLVRPSFARPIKSYEDALDEGEAWGAYYRGEGLKPIVEGESDDERFRSAVPVIVRGQPHIFRCSGSASGRGLLLNAVIFDKWPRGFVVGTAPVPSLKWAIEELAKWELRDNAGALVALNEFVSASHPRPLPLHASLRPGDGG